MHLGVLLWNVMPAQWGNVRHSLVWLETRVRECSGSQGAHRNEIRAPPPPPTPQNLFHSRPMLIAESMQTGQCLIGVGCHFEGPFSSNCLLLTPSPLFLELKSGIYAFAVARCDLIYSSSRCTLCLILKVFHVMASAYRFGNIHLPSKYWQS